MTQSEKLSQEQTSYVVDYAVYEAYQASGKRDQKLFVQFAENVIEVLTKTGMCLIDNAPITEMKDRIVTVSKAFFRLPDEIKNQFVFPNYTDRGYVPYGLKKPEDYKNMYLADSAIYKAMQGIGFDQIKDVRDQAGMETALEVKNHLPDFNDTIVEFSRRGYEMTHAFCEVMAHHFELSGDYLNKMKHGNNGLRLLHYMPLTEEVRKSIPNITRAKPHADISAFTFLLTADEPGLKIATKETVNKKFGTNFITNDQMADIDAELWMDFKPKTNQCIMNIGRTVEILSNGVLLATPHMVEPVPGREEQERFSIPFFGHLPWDLPLDVWPKAVDLRDGVNYFMQKGPSPVTISEYVQEDSKRKWVEPVCPVPVYQP